VLSGTWHVRWGDTYDPAMPKALPPGSFYTEPAGVPHFVTTPDGNAVVQITGTGPTTVDYVDPAHAPKNELRTRNAKDGAMSKDAGGSIIPRARLRV
jgi:hypothetical protein